MATGDQPCPRLPHRRDQAPARRSRLIADDERRYYGMQFHPEVVHTPDGAKLLRISYASCLRLLGRLDDGGVPRDQDRGNPRAGRHGR
jgi:hypothetical protein